MAAYARISVTRDGTGWVVVGNTATLAAIAQFATMAGGAGGTVTHFGVGPGASGATQLLFFGTVTPNYNVAIASTPKLDTNTAISNVTPDALANAAATALLNLLLNNTAWTGIGDAGGILPSAADGVLYLSLHTASPAEGGTQATNEMAYT